MPASFPCRLLHKPLKMYKYPGKVGALPENLQYLTKSLAARYVRLGFVLDKISNPNVQHFMFDCFTLSL